MRRATSLVLSLCLVGAAGCGGQRAPAASTPTGAPPAATTAAAATPTTPATPTTTATTPPPRPHPRSHRPSLLARGLADGRLPPTMQLPSAATPRFAAEMRALFAGVRSGRVAPAMGAFFPETAYAQVKAIADPAADFSGRLVPDFALDLAAAHALLGPGAAGARLLEVQVPGAAVRWVAPGVCANRLGYYEVPNARLVYRADGTVRSFGIASLIAWRGVWYVVHLGAVVRTAPGGIVDAPSTGPGVSAPSSTC